MMDENTQGRMVATAIKEYETALNKKHRLEDQLREAEENRQAANNRFHEQLNALLGEYPAMRKHVSELERVGISKRIVTSLIRANFHHIWQLFYSPQVLELTFVKPDGLSKESWHNACFAARALLERSKRVNNPPPG
jgi:predicted nuclease with TOPRIM domain